MFFAIEHGRLFFFSFPGFLNGNPLLVSSGFLNGELLLVCSSSLDGELILVYSGSKKVS